MPKRSSQQRQRESQITRGSNREHSTQSRKLGWQSSQSKCVPCVDERSTLLVADASGIAVRRPQNASRATKRRNTLTNITPFGPGSGGHECAWQHRFLSRLVLPDFHVSSVDTFLVGFACQWSNH
eukprot:4415140-Amphidinium_carterae.2